MSWKRTHCSGWSIVAGPFPDSRSHISMFLDSKNQFFVQPVSRLSVTCPSGDPFAFSISDRPEASLDADGALEAMRKFNFVESSRVVESVVRPALAWLCAAVNERLQARSKQGSFVRFYGRRRPRRRHKRGKFEGCCP